ncbi:MAG: plastocyanin/azurin family copper-binding protein [Halobacteriaceae archaeon]
MTQTRLTRRRLLQSAAGFGVAGLAGCIGSSGGSHSEGDGNPPGHGEHQHHHEKVSEPKQTREVLVNTARKPGTDAYHFKPHVTWVTVGGTVTWKLQSGNHTATAYHPGNDEPRLVPKGTEAWDSGMLTENGETYSHTFDTEGVYHYFCKPHEKFGMLGTVIVGRPHPEEQIALGKIPDNKPKEVRGKLKELNEMVRSILKNGHHEETDHHAGNETGHHHEDDHHNETTTTHHHEE